MPAATFSHGPSADAPPAFGFPARHDHRPPTAAPDVVTFESPIGSLAGSTVEAFHVLTIDPVEAAGVVEPAVVVATPALVVTVVFCAMTAAFFVVFLVTFLVVAACARPTLATHNALAAMQRASSWRARGGPMGKGRAHGGNPVEWT